jgi:hypothetical protein
MEPADFAELMAAETWLTGQEAIELGLADAIAEDAPKAKAKWDLSAYDNAPEQYASGGEIVVKIDASEVADTGAKIIEQIRAEVAKVVPQEPQIPEKITETEQKRPNFAADMLLRPAA